MLLEQIPIERTAYWSATALAYLSDPKLEKFYSRKPQPGSFAGAIAERQFPLSSRKVLSDALLRQYDESGINLADSDKVRNNIYALREESTFTITTGQQIHLFLGPLLVLYKTITAIKLAEEVSSLNPGKKIVPVFWMASEDHDLEEINKTQFLTESYTWQPGQKGAVGRMSTEKILEIIKELSVRFSHDETVLRLLEQFEDAYSRGKALASATRILMHGLFSQYGLIILDPDDAALKKLFVEKMEADILEGINCSLIKEQSSALSSLGFQTQVNPREINHFYLDNGLRERLVFENDSFKVLNSDISFSRAEMAERVKNSPESFSPNVVMRPLYQETILPNLAYVPGSNELIYWLQLKSSFEANGVYFPILWPRVSVLLTNEKKAKIVEEMDLQWSDLFLPETEFKQLTLAKIGVQNLPAGYLQEIKRAEQDLYQVLRPAGIPIKELLDQFKKLNDMINRSVKQAEEYFINRNLKQVDRLNQLRSEITFSSAQERKQFIANELLKNNDKLIHALMQDLSTILGSLLIVKI